MERYLEHHGIKGMKWGVRRTDEQLGHDTSSSASSTKKMNLFQRIKARREQRVAEARNAELEKYANEWANEHWVDSWNATADEWNEGSKKNKLAKYNRRLKKAKSSDEEDRILEEQDADFQTDFNNHLVNATNAELARYKKERGYT